MSALGRSVRLAYLNGLMPEGLVMTDRLRKYIYWLACVIAVVWLALGAVDIAVGLGRGRGINLIEVVVLLVVAIMIFGLGLGVRKVQG
jgi:hypothetical protein